MHIQAKKRSFFGRNDTSLSQPRVVANAFFQRGDLISNQWQKNVLWFENPAVQGIKIKHFGITQKQGTHLALKSIP